MLTKQMQKQLCKVMDQIDGEHVNKPVSDVHRFFVSFRIVSFRIDLAYHLYLDACDDISLFFRIHLARRLHQKKNLLTMFLLDNLYLV